MSENDKAIEVRGFMNPTTIKEGMELAEWIAKSDLAPKDYKDKPRNVLIAMQMGLEVGLSPMQALQNIAVINGRPSIWGDSMLALVQSHREFESIDENESNATKGVCVVKRRGMEPQRREFTIDDAKKAGLFGKQGPWQTAPARMLKLRARAFALRDTFADALRGLQSAEEERDIVETTTITEPVQAPRRASETKLGEQPGLISPEKAIETENSKKTITLDQARAFFAAARESGKTDETIKAYLCSCGFSSSLTVTTGKYDEVMEWARGGKVDKSTGEIVEHESPLVGQ